MSEIITGIDLVKGIESLLAEQSLSSQNWRQMASTVAISKFAQKHGIPPQTGAISTISKALKQDESVALSQIRDLSEDLRKLESAQLEGLFQNLKHEVEQINAKAHQTKTRSAFISAFLRPFANRYTSKWFSQPSDINVPESKRMIEYLERKKIKDIKDVLDWADDVVELFIEVVVYIDRDADSRFTRPIGTVSEKSSRTYLQSWGAFIQDEAPKILRLAIDLKEGTSPKDSKVDYKLLKDGSLQIGLAKPSFSTRKPLPGRPYSSSAKAQSKSSLTDLSLSLVIEVSIESNLDKNAVATRKWLSKNEFESSIKDWVSSFPELWAQAANDFCATVKIQNFSGESSISLPSLEPNTAVEKIKKAVGRQI